MTIVVIGAGIAGITAARSLVNSGREVVVLEARNRIGGRIFTRRDLAQGIPIEMGAEFIHGNKVPQWELVNKLKLRTLHWEKMDDSLVRTETGDMLTMREARQDPLFDITRTWNLPKVPLTHDDEDLYHYLLRLGFTRDQLQYTRRSFVNAAAGSIHHISARATLEEMHDETTGEGDYRILDGYDTLVKHLADGLDIRLNSPVDTVEWADDTVRVILKNGEILDAEKVVVAVPLPILQKSILSFEPRLPKEKRTAMSMLEMGIGMKMIYVFDQPILPEGIAALYSAKNPTMWWAPSFGHDNQNQYVITAFATGDWARELYRLGEVGMINRGLRTLREELGKAIPEPINVHIENWTEDPYTLGVYSVVMPGGYEGRKILAAPLEGKLYWAGEATADNAWAATVHGAYASGKRAAREILEA